MILHNAISLDGRLDGFNLDVGLYYEIAGRLGADAILSGSNTILTAFGVARTDGVCIAIQGEGLRKLCVENPAYGYVMMTQVARTLRDRLTATRIQLAAA
ncbi:MAG: hypothetical protein A2Z17_00650 [Gammaproteobacteria bacterium RBG_16_66_13]|nr:MAG: hypothetical protein A2Z17_00650 [Gammaproteobacteria bacterium RBG_16_66_13]